MSAVSDSFDEAADHLVAFAGPGVRALIEAAMPYFAGVVEVGVAAVTDENPAFCLAVQSVAVLGCEVGPFGVWRLRLGATNRHYAPTRSDRD